MTTNYLTLTRQSLYDLVWSKPMTELAKEFGISDVGLAKRCRTVDVPVPPSGWWARKAANQNPPRTIGDTPTFLVSGRPEAHLRSAVLVRRRLIPHTLALSSIDLLIVLFLGRPLRLVRRLRPQGKVPQSHATLLALQCRQSIRQFQQRAAR